MKKVLLLLTLLPLIVSAQVKRTIHVETAGTLPTLISEEEKYEIEELTLSGELNGTDFKFIREMAGVNDKVCKEFDGDWIKWVEYIPTEGILKSLNLAESKIVSGGEPYYYEGDKPITGSALIEKYYTVSDAISSYLFARTILEIIILPNSITSISPWAFYNCNSLKSITIPKNVTVIYNGVFTNCPGLTSINVESGNQKYDSRNNCNAIIDNNNQLIAGCKNTIIPNSVTSIGVCAFEGCSGLTSINIPDKVTSIGDCAFQGCSGLKSVTSLNPVPPSITSYSLGSVYEKAALNVPYGSKKAYMNADFWKLFKTINEVGDINGDGTVDSSDIEEIKEYLMGNPSDYFNEDNADVNEDGYVNIADIVAIINIIKNNSDSDKSDHYLTFVAEETGTFKFSGTAGNDYISYSLDNGRTWNTLASDTDSPTVQSGQKIMWKGNLTPTSSGIGHFESTGRFAVEGNAHSLLWGDDFQGHTDLTGKDFAFKELFYNCTTLASAENLVLPATTLASDCYYRMFDGCTSLTTAPELPATILTYACYSYMFRNCTSLTTAPELPATELATNCYIGMFNGCSSLNYIKCLISTFRFDWDYTTNWVSGVSPTGTFVKASSMSRWSRGVDGIPSGWTVQDDTTPGNDKSGNYLTFVAEEAGTFKFSGTTGNDYIQYSLDSGNTWNTLASNTDSPIVSQGQKIMWKGNLIPTSNGVGTFCSTGRFTVEGNAMSLLYGDNFIGQTSLSVKDYAFISLFSGCTSLTSAENLSLPATTLAEKCYRMMFRDCTSLTTAPELPATTLAIDCYEEMFQGCTSLTTAPTLPATTLAAGCYGSLFAYCTNLTTAPTLPATTLAKACYAAMFYGCTRLTTAPELPATTLATWCYQFMFEGCTSLNSITCLATDISANYCTTDWVKGVLSSGTFVKAQGTAWTTGDSGIPSGWTVQESGNYLSFVAQETGTFKFSGTTGNDHILYSLDGGTTWYEFPATPDTPAVEVCAGQRIMWKGEMSPKTNGIGRFYSTGRFTVEGNVMSLLFGDNFEGQTSLSGYDNAFNSLFRACTGLTSVDNLVLPATTLTYRCYYRMFEECTSLTKAPVLPATTLAGYCYQAMFYNCSGLTVAPQLPVESLSEGCYNRMFYGCTSLATAPSLPATTLTDDCYFRMFYGCSSLTTAPELPATTLAAYCYYEMFAGCTSLNYIKCLATDRTADACTYNWVEGVSSSGTFVKAQGTAWTTGDSGISSGWTVQNDTPSGTADGDKITDDEGNNSSSNIVGVWEVTSIDTNVSVRNAIGEKMHFNADGTYSDPLDSGRWSISGNKLTIIFSSPDMVPVEFLVLALTDSELSLKAVLDEYSGNQFSHSPVWLIIHFKKVG